MTNRWCLTLIGGVASGVIFLDLKKAFDITDFAQSANHGKSSSVHFAKFGFNMSFQKVRDSLIRCLADKVIDYEEFVPLYNAYQSKNAAYPYWENKDFCLNSLSLDECFAQSEQRRSSTFSRGFTGPETFQTCPGNSL